MKIRWISGFGQPADSFLKTASAAGLLEESTFHAALDFFEDHDSSFKGFPSKPGLSLAAEIRRRGNRELLVGWSLGGNVALEAAALCSEFVVGLVLIGVAPVFTENGKAENGFKRWWSANPESEVEQFRERLLQDPTASFRMFRKRMGAESNPHSLDHWGHATIPRLNSGMLYLKTADLTQCLNRVECPMLIIHGARDKIVRLARESLPQTIHGNRVVVVQNGGHALPETHPEELGLHVRAFAELGISNVR